MNINDIFGMRDNIRIIFVSLFSFTIKTDLFQNPIYI